MPTLRNVQGGSLVPDFSQGIETALRVFGTGRERAAEAQQLRLADVISGDPEALRPEEQTEAGDAPTSDQKTQAMLRLSTLNPVAAQGIQKTLESNNAIEAARIQTQTIKAQKNAVFIAAGKTFVERRKRIMTIANQKRAAGEDLSGITTLAGLAKGKLDLELKSRITQFSDMKTLMAPTSESITERGIGGVPTAETTVTTDPLRGQRVTERKAPVQPQQFIEQTTPEGLPTGIQMNTTTNKLEAIPGRGAQTELAKIEVDRRNGLLTTEQAKKQTAIFEATPPKFQSAVGKLLGDQALALGLYEGGEDSPQFKALQAAIESEQKGDGPSFSDIAGLRKEHTKASGDFIKQRDAVNKINAARPNAAGDLSLIFNFMKVLDPQSTVRESEFANAQNAAGVPVRIMNVWNRLKAGEFLSAPQRAQFKTEALQIFNAGLQSQALIDTTYTDLAKRHGINPQDVVIDWKAGLTKATTPKATEDIVKGINLPKGG
jgi:hypothetical protein